MVYDFLFVSINRLINRKSIFKPDNSHLHHVIKDEFYGNKISPIILFLLVNSLIIYFGYKISEISKLMSLSIFIIGFTYGMIIGIIYPNYDEKQLENSATLIGIFTAPILAKKGINKSRNYAKSKLN